MMDLIIRYETWLIFGLLLVILEMLLGLEFFALTFGIAAILTGTTILIEDILPFTITQSWKVIVTYYALLSVVVLIPTRKVLNKLKSEGGDDINEY